MLYAEEPRQNLDGTTSVKIMSTITPRRLQEVGIMPKARVMETKTIHIALELTEEEARRLMTIMQNPFDDSIAQYDPSAENPIESSIRRAIFEPLYAHFHGNSRSHSSFTLVAEEDDRSFQEAPEFRASLQRAVREMKKDDDADELFSGPGGMRAKE